ncbi:MAG: branched-chain amino acid ABC transporter substrate-binding protein [Anaerolineales bacterium]|nr:MAG: branched-chain amino acid ABC transporter substrate-binding protein [Anaerolineales bacterium]
MRNRFSLLWKRSHKGLVLTLCLLLVLGLVAAQCAPGAGKKETVKISFIGPLTGGNAGPGLGGRNSFLLAVKERNEDPDTKYNYEVVQIDDECKPDVGVQAALKASSDPDVVAGASHYCSMVAISTADTFHNQGMPSMVWGAVLPDITYGNDYVEITRVNGTQINQNEVHAKMMYDMGYRTVSILHDTTDYGRGHLKYFSESWEALGGQILSVQGVNVDQQDYTAELTKIKAENPDFIYFGGLTPSGIPIRKQMVKLGIEAQFNGTSGIKNESFNEALGPDAEGVICFLEGAPIDELPGGKAFLEKYEAEGYEEPPEAYGPFAYVAGHLIIDAIEKVGPDRAKVAEELEKNTKDRDTIIGKVSFDDHGQNIVPLITAYVSQDGKWVSWNKSEYAGGQRQLVPPK